MALLSACKQKQYALAVYKTFHLTHAKYEAFKYQLIVLLLYHCLQTFIASAALLKSQRVAADCLWQQTLHSDARMQAKDHAFIMLKYIRLNADSK